ncbi:MAG: choice-of-anchor D domain-containing protein [Calditrichaeota bacterium]|nr:choice-of-anchor D domain-containing protein [Calditrichota bacterium]
MKQFVFVYSLLFLFGFFANSTVSAQEANQAFQDNGRVQENIPDRDRRGDRDEMGYYWIDSNENDGPQFQWFEIEREEYLVLPDGNWDEQNSGVLELGFPFTWYGQVYNSIRVGEKGWVTFDENFEEPNLGDIGQFPAQGINTLLRVNACDIQMEWGQQDGGGRIYYRTGDNFAIVSWVEIPFEGDWHVKTTFQLIISNEGWVKCQYDFQDGQRGEFSTIAYETDDYGELIHQGEEGYIRDELAILIGQGAGHYEGHRGQPDEAGYFWVNRGENDGPGFNWINIENDENRWHGIPDDWNSGEVELGFDFDWYGEVYNSMRFSSNGWITFDPNYEGNNNVNGNYHSFPQSPNEDDPNSLLLVNHRNFRPENQYGRGEMYSWSNGEMAVVSWVSWPQWLPDNMEEYPDNRSTFQAIISRDGWIKYQYGEQIGEYGDWSEIGYESPDGQMGASIAHLNPGRVYPGEAILIEKMPDGPGIAVSPQQLESTNEDEFTLTVRNRGDDELVWDIGVRQPENENAPGRDLDGAPDDAGYYWIDSAEEGGPEFSWIDIVHDDNALNADEYAMSGELELGFDVEWYEETYNSLYSHPDGWATFVATDERSIRQPPDPREPNSLLIVGHGPFSNAGHSADTYFWSDPDNGIAVVTWHDLHYYDDWEITSTFQLIINADGTIKYQYGPQAGVNGSQETVGYESPDGQKGDDIVRWEEGRIQEGLAIEIRRGDWNAAWVDYSPVRGRLNGRRSQNVLVEFNPIGLEPGDYAADMHFYSNDEENPDVVVDLFMQVTEGPNVTVSTDEINFGRLLVGESDNATFEIQNIGNSNLTISDITIEGAGFVTDFQNEIVLEPSAVTEINVTFAPEEPREYENVLSITSNDQNGATNILLRGGGVSGPAEDNIIYHEDDDMRPWPASNYWSKVTFEVEEISFDLYGTYFKIVNDRPNLNSPCQVKVYAETEEHDLGDLLWETTIESLDATGAGGAWIWVGIPEEERITFENGDKFTIMFGPAPGGDYRQENPGPGWWAVHDGVHQLQEFASSYYFAGENPPADHADWLTVGGGRSNLLVRANGAMTWFERPRIAVDPLDIGPDVGEYGVTVTNEGALELDWWTELEILEEEMMRDNRGRNDVAEYRWYDNNEEDGPDYEWIDIVSQENALNMRNDSYARNTELGFEFNWYGNDYSTIDIAANGYIIIGGGGGNSIGPAPYPMDPNNLLIVCHYYYRPETGGDVYFATFEDYTVISWVNLVTQDRNDSRTNFQAIISVDGSVKYQYGPQINYNARNANIGYENEDGRIGATISYQQEGYVQEELAILIYNEPIPDWLSIEPRSGVLAGGESTDMTINLIGEGIAGANYNAELHFRSNDPVNSDIVIDINFELADAPVIQAADDTHNFGEVYIGVLDDWDLSIHNGGNMPLIIEGVNTDDEQFGATDEFPVEIASGADGTITLFYAPDQDGESAATVSLVTNDPNFEGGYPLEVTGIGVVPPEIIVESESISEVEAGDYNLNVANNGGSELIWRADLHESGEERDGNIRNVRSVSGQDVIAPRRDSWVEPDDGGYVWIDTEFGPDDYGVAEYEWIDITGNVDPFPNVGRNWNSGALELGFDVDWYGESYSQIYICSNGWASFTARDGSGNLPVPPHESNPNAVLLVNSYDQSLSNGRIYFHSANGMAVITWFWTSGVGWVNQNKISTYQAIISEEGWVKYQYSDQRNQNGELSNIGYESPNGQLGGSIAYRQAGMVYDGQAFQIGTEAMMPPDWIGIEPHDGVLQANENQDIVLTFNSEGMADGDYYADLHLLSNDPFDSDVVVDVMFSVGDADIVVEPESLAFGEVRVGEDLQQTLTISNAGVIGLVVGDVVIDGAGFTTNYEGEFRLEPEESSELIVTFAPEEIMDYAVTLTFISNDDDMVIHLGGSGYIPPIIAVDPDLVEADGAGEQNLNILNDGGMNLEWSAYVLGPHRDEVIRNVRSVVNRENASNRDRMGEVDEGGYYWIDSENGVEFEWIDIAQEENFFEGNGSLVSDPVDFGFEFTWYGEQFTNMVINPSGYVSLGESMARWNMETPPPAPNPSLPNNCLYINNQSLQPSRGGEMYYRTGDGLAVLSWINVMAHYEEDKRATFQLVISEEGWVKYQYGEQVELDGSLAQIGYESPDGELGAAIHFRQEGAYIQEGLAILIGTDESLVPEWISWAPDEGVIAPGENQNLTLSFSIIDIDEGVHTADLHIESNAPDEPIITIPVTLTVNSSPIITLDTDLLEYGEVVVTRNRDLSFNITNRGNADLIISDAVIEGDGFYLEFEELAIARGESIELTVTFEPEAGDEFEGVLTLTTNDDANNQVSINLTGTGINVPIISIDPEAIAFGDVMLRGESDQILTITNIGTSRLVVSDISIEGDGFGTDFAEEMVIHGQDLAELTVTFAPQRMGGHEATLTISSDNYDGDVNIPLTGVSLAPPGVTPETIETNRAGDHTVTISNLANFNLQWSAELERVSEPRQDGEERNVRGVEEHGPQRDALGDVIHEFDGPVNNITGMAYLDGKIWASSYGAGEIAAVDVETHEVTDRFDFPHGSPVGLGSVRGELWAGLWDGFTVYRYNTAGELLGTFNLPEQRLRGMCWDGGDRLIFNSGWSRMTHVWNIDSGEMEATINAGIYSSGLEWVNSHENGQLWSFNGGYLLQLDLDVENGTIEVVREYESMAENDLNGPAHDGENLWHGVWEGNTWYVLDDGIEEPRVEWVSFDPGEGVIAQNNFAEMTVAIITDGLAFGEYVANINFQTNDQNHEYSSVNVTLQVLNTPVIVADQERLDFGDVPMGGTEAVDLTISNEGVAPLLISEVITSAEIFDTDFEGEINIAVGESTVLSVSYSPVEAGRQNGTLTISSNDQANPELELALTGFGLNPPVIEIDPDQIETDQPGDYIVSISNSGDTDLEWDAEVVYADQQRDIATRNVRSIVGSALNRDNAGDQLDRFNSPLWTTSGMASSLDGRMWACSYSNASIAAVDIESGEELISFEFPYGGLMAMTWVRDELWAIPNHSPRVYRYNPEGEHLGTFDLPHREIYGLAWDGNNRVFYHSTDGNLIRVWDIDNSEVIGTIENFRQQCNNAEIHSIEWVEHHPDGQLWGITRGRVYQMAVNEDDWSVRYVQDFAVNADENLVAIGHDGEDLWYAMWAQYHWYKVDDGNQEVAHWLMVDPSNGTVTPDQTGEMTAAVDLSQLDAGDHEADIVFSSNDPDNAETSVHVIVHVSADPIISVEPAVLEFGEVLAGSSSEQVVLINNIGRSDLIVSEVIVDGDGFNTDFEAEVTIPARRSVELAVTFTPEDNIDYAATLLINSNDENNQQVTVDLTGSGYNSPIISVDPEAIRANESGQYNVAISNVGDRDLIWNAALEMVADPGQDNNNRLMRQVNGAGPNRDEAGDILDRFNGPFASIGGMTSALDGKIWAVSYTDRRYGAIDVESGQVTDNYAVGQGGALAICWVRNEFWIVPWSGRTVYRYNDRGQALGQFDMPNAQINGLGWDGDNRVYYNSRDDNRIHVWDIARSRHEASFDIRQQTGNADIWGIEWVEQHPEGQLWCNATHRMFQISVNTDNWQTEFVQDFVTEADQAYVGPGHDGENIWHGMWGNNTWYKLHDGIEEAGDAAEWITFNPVEGRVAPDATDDLTVMIDLSDIGEEYGEANIHIMSNDPNNNEVVVSVMVNVVDGPIIAIEPESIAFDAVDLGASAERVLSISNTGNQNLVVSNVVVNGEYFSTDFDAEFSVEPENSVELSITFAPGAVGDFEGSLVITSNVEGNEELTINLTGTGVGYPAILVEPELIESNDGGDYSITISNSGDINLEWTTNLQLVSEPGQDLAERQVRKIDGSEPIRDDVYDWLSLSAYEGVTEPNGTDEITASLNPAGQLAGDYEANIHFVSNDLDNEDVAVSVIMHVSEMTAISVEPEAIDFGGILVGQSGDQIFTVSNVGNTNLLISGISVDDGAFSTNFEGELTLNPQHDLQVLVTFTPQDGIDYSGTVTVNSNDPDNQQVAVSVSGSGLTSPAIAIDPEFINTARSGEHSVTISNIGGLDLEWDANLEIIAEPEQDRNARGTRGVDDNGPRRDDAGDVLGQYNSGVNNTSGLTSTLDGRIWGCSYGQNRIVSMNIDNGEVLSNWAGPGNPLAITWTGEELWVVSYSGNVVTRYNLDGQALGTFNVGFRQISGMGSDLNGHVYMNSQDDRRVHVIRIEDRQQVGLINYRPAAGNADIWGIEWVQDHQEGQLWCNTRNRMYQVAVDDNWQCQAVQNFATNADQSYVGPGHDGENLWHGMWNGNTWYKIDDGVDEVQRVQWISFEPANGTVAPEEFDEMTVTIDASEVNVGDYEAEVIINSNDPDNPESIVNVLLNIGGGQAIISIEPESLDFGNVVIGDVGELTLSITNIGNVALTVSEFSIDGDAFDSDFDGEFDLPRNNTAELMVTFTPDEVGDYAGTVTISSNDEENPEVEVVLAGVGLDPPTISIDPEDVLAFESGDYPVTITNEGDLNLEWSANLEIFDEQRDRSVRTARGVTQTSPERDGRGDRDDMGWEWRDNLEDDGPEFEWVDVRQLEGVRTYNMGDDQNTGALQLGWTYTFWGREFRTIYANTDAWASFTYSGNGYNISPAGYPSAANGNVRNANFINFMQVDHTQGTTVWFWTNGQDLARIMWAGNQNTWFELALHGNGLAVMQYGQGVAARNCGVNLGDGQHGWYFGNQIGNGRAIAFGPANVWESSWISMDPAEGVIEPDASDELIISLNAADLEDGIYTADVIINSNDPNNGELIIPVELNLGQIPVIAVDQQSIEFGNVNLGETGQQTLTISNEGSVELIVTDISAAGEFFGVNFDGEFAIAPNESEEVTVTYTPEEIDNHQGTLTITSNDPDSGELTLQLTGAGVGQPVIGVDPREINSENGGDYALTLSNSGNANLIWESMLEVVGEPGQDQASRSVRSIAGDVKRDDPAEWISWEPAEGMIEPDASIQVSIVLDGAGINLGMYEANLHFLSNDEQNPDLAVNITMTVTYPVISVNPEALDFGEIYIGESDQQILTIRNDGNADLIVTGAAVNGEYFTSNFEAEFRVAPGGTAEISVTFAPEEVGNYDGSIVLTSTDPENAEITVNMMGTGAEVPAPIIYIDPDELIFEAEVGQNQDLNVGISNIGNADLTIGEIVVQGHYFSGNAGNIVLAPDENYVFTVVFEPEEIGEFEGGVIVTSDDPNNREVHLRLLGFGIGSPVIHVDPNNLEFGGVSLDNIEDLPLTIRNVGNIPLQVENISVDGYFSTDFEGGFTLQPNDASEIAVTFAPEEPGVFETNILITSDDPENGQMMVAVSGIGLNDAPEIVNPIEDIVVDEDSGILEVADLDDVFSDPNGDELTFRFEGTEELDLNLTEENVLTLTPTENFNGDNIEVFVFADDGWNDNQMANGNVENQVDMSSILVSANRRIRSILGYSPAIQRDMVTPHSFLVTVIPVNDMPSVIGEIADITIDEDPGMSEIADLGDVFEDVDNEQLTYFISDVPEELGMEISQEGVLFLEPENNFNLPDGIEITISAFDPADAFAEVSFLLTIVSVNDAPVVANAIGDITVDQGVGRVDVADLDDVFTDIDMEDQNPDILNFRILEVPEELNMVIDEENLLYFSAEDDFTLPDGIEIIVSATDNANLTAEEVFNLTITPVGQDRELVLELHQNWNLISINVVPGEEFWVREEGPDVIRMLAQFTEDDENHVLLFKDEDGLFYLPAFNFNNIPFWDLTTGYQIKLDLDFDATWSGEPIPPDMDIPLEENWNFAAYLPNYELDASAPDFHVLSPILDNLITAKDGNGQFMLPAFNFSNMPPWREGLGYQIRVDAEVVLNYPPEPEDVQAVSVGENMTSTPKHWQMPTGTDNNMSVLVFLVDGFEGGLNSQVGAFNSDGQIIGCGIVENTDHSGIAIWGDDQSTRVNEGIKNGETFELRLWDSQTGIESELELVNSKYGNGLTYEPNGLSVVELQVKPEIPDYYYLTNAYPNPFNSITGLTFGLPESGQVLISVFDVAGRQIAVLKNEMMNAGNHQIKWDAGDNANGVYLIQMNSNGYHANQKVVLVK